MFLSGMVFLLTGLAFAAFCLTFGVTIERDEEFPRLFELVVNLALFGGSVPFGIGLGLLVGSSEVHRNGGLFPK